MKIRELLIGTAAMIRCPSVMLNRGSGSLTENLGPTIATLKSMAAYGNTENVAGAIENRGRFRRKLIWALVGPPATA
jgi:hypothetical protein